MKRVYFVRHGETRANLEQYLAGPDEPLTETGFTQAAALAKRVAQIDVDTLLTSSYVRTHQTAEVISKVTGLLIKPETHFTEWIESSRFFGVSEDDDELNHFRMQRNEHVEDHSWKEDDGESAFDLFRRINKAKTLLESIESENTLVVSHAMFIRSFTASVLLNTDVPTVAWMTAVYNLKLSNTGLSYFTHDEGKWKLVLWNDLAHFAE